jgi:hypothetical protein
MPMIAMRQTQSLWAWRNLAPPPAPPAPPAPSAPAAAPGVSASVVKSFAGLTLDATHFRPAPFATLATQAVQSDSLMARRSLAQRFEPATRASSDYVRLIEAGGARIPIDPIPWPRHPVPTPVATNTLALSMKYLVVRLSRAAWWSNLILADSGWFLPGQARGGLVPAPGDDLATCLPIALIVTSNVSIAGNWTDTDRASATANTHLGPWSLAGSQFETISETAVLTLPGMTMIGAIYAVLPAVPPLDAPAAPG